MLLTSHDERFALQLAGELEGPVAAVENRLTALGLALHRQDSDGVEHEAAQLHAALAAAIQHFARAARKGSVPPPLRHRLAVASGQVAAQREALARATASLDRAIDVLMPGALPPSGLYTAIGGAERGAASGSLLA